jgi:hypothetical protein
MYFAKQWVKKENELEFSVLGAGTEFYCERKSLVWPLAMSKRSKI